MGKIKVKIKRLHHDAKVPVHATEQAAGCDFYALEDSIILPGETRKVSTGICLEIPLGHYMRIEDRSGMAIKGVHKLAGIIDSDYRGEVCIVLHNTTNKVYNIEKHDRIAQGIITPVSQADFEDVGQNELSETERGTGGFHSTGKRDNTEVIIVAGVARNRVIGNKGELPWHISEDLKRFKDLTLGNPVIMGRVTYLSILKYLGKPLPGRTNIVLTEYPADEKEGFIFCRSVDEALSEAKKHGSKIYIIGGASVYGQFMDRADKLELTEIDKEFEGDTFFPNVDRTVWNEIRREDKQGENFGFSFVTYKRKRDSDIFNSVLADDDNQEVKVHDSNPVLKLDNRESDKNIMDNKSVENRFDNLVERDVGFVNNLVGGGNDEAGQKSKGMFIAFEGIDGCGKSTQIRKLVQHIFEKSKYHHIILTRNPYKDVNIRSILHQDSNPLSQAEKLADLFIEDRQKHVEEMIKPNLEKGYFVISDRFKISTIVYQATQGLDMQRLIDKQKDFPIPNLTFIVDVSPEEARRRMEKEDVSIRGQEHKFEAHLDFAKKLRENHFRAKELLTGEKIFIIDGERETEEIFEEIKNIFEEEMRNVENMKNQ